MEDTNNAIMSFLPLEDAPAIQPELEIEQGDIVEYVQDEEALAE